MLSAPALFSGPWNQALDVQIKNPVLMARNGVDHDRRSRCPLWVYKKEEAVIDLLGVIGFISF